jgi:glycosyltransferase involved in cell wall biosynthesis
MGNAREIISRLDPDIFHVSTFVLNPPDPRITARKNTRLIQLPRRRQTVRILSEFLWGTHDLLFYLKVSPASRVYMNLRRKWRDRRVTIGTIESQCNVQDEPDVTAEGVRYWSQTVLRCDRLYSNSPFVQSSLHKEFGLGSDVIRTGADTKFFTPAWDRPKNSRLRVLYAGSLCTRKQPQVMLSAAARFPEADFRIVGKGALENEITSRIGRDRLSNVSLLGALQPEQLREEYRQADIFLFPSIFEGSPKVIVEAAACGLPVIARDSYQPETVLHGVTGFQANSEEELYSFLKLLLARPELRSQMGRAGREHSQKFDWDPITRDWENAFIEASSAKLRKAS